MMSAVSFSLGATAVRSVSFAWPTSISPSRLVVWNLLLLICLALSGVGKFGNGHVPPTTDKGTKHLPINTTAFKSGHLERTLSFRIWYCPQSTNRIAASVCVRPYVIASWPKVV